VCVYIYVKHIKAQEHIKQSDAYNCI